MHKETRKSNSNRLEGVENTDIHGIDALTTRAKSKKWRVQTLLSRKIASSRFSTQFYVRCHKSELFGVNSKHENRRRVTPEDHSDVMKDARFITSHERHSGTRLGLREIFAKALIAVSAWSGRDLLIVWSPSLNQHCSNSRLTTNPHLHQIRMNILP
jgi:hypothetical protein